MSTELTPLLQVAKEILKGAGRKGMHVNDIAEAAVSHNKNMGLPAEELSKKLLASLSRNLKLKTSKPTFAKVNWDKGPRKGKPKQGWYRLRPEKATPVAEAIEIPKTDKNFLGKAGEFAVMSELLFWGFNASVMTVDDGIDIVASKHNKFFHIQVKTATKQDSGKYLFTINPASFKKYHAANVYYVFVLRDRNKNEFIVIPSTHIDYLIEAGVITGTTVLSLIITCNQEGTKLHLNGKNDITPFYGRFGKLIN